MSTVVEKWPSEYSKEVIVGNPTKPTAVCCLWTERDFAAGEVGLENVAAVGNLYSHGPGIEGIVRNILANPSIRKIFIAGKDKSDSAKTLMQLFRSGVTEGEIGWTIPLAEGLREDDIPEGMRTIDKAIPLEAIDLLRQKVGCVDLSEKDWGEVQSELGYTQDELPFATPTLYPKTEATNLALKGEGVGFTFRGSNPSEVWLDILRTIRRFGYKGDSRYTSTTQEILDIVATLDGDTEKMMESSTLMGVTPEAVRSYARQLIEGVKLDEEDTYAYGERMRVKKGDQIAALVEKLRQRPFDRGLVIDLWDIDNDFYGQPTSPPCLTQGWFRVSGGKLYANYSYRSHDIFRGWPKNFLGDRLHHADIAQKSGWALGATTLISYSAHIYEHDYPSVNAILASNPPVWEFNEDPRGNFIIDIADNQIVVRHENRSGAVTTFSGTSANKLSKEIWANKLILLPDHALYIGGELAKAEISLKTGIDYDQDRA